MFVVVMVCEIALGLAHSTVVVSSARFARSIFFVFCLRIFFFAAFPGGTVRHLLLILRRRISNLKGKLEIDKLRTHRCPYRSDLVLDYCTPCRLPLSALRLKGYKLRRHLPLRLRPSPHHGFGRREIFYYPNNETTPYLVYKKNSIHCVI